MGWGAIAIPPLSLIDKYGVTGPRYTSYPTALAFDESFNDRHFIAATANSNEDLIPAPLSLYVHIPFCRSLCYYCGCHKKVTRNVEFVNRYLQSLQLEIRDKGRLFDDDRRVMQLHLGGGTPTYLSPIQRAQLMARLRTSFNLIDDEVRDYSIEIDPRTIDVDALGELAELGFNRVSFGVQDFDPAVQQAINRVQSRHEVERLIRSARQHDFDSVSVDLIYGLPMQTTASFKRTVEQILELRPDTLSVFNYAHLPKMFPAQRLIDGRDLPSAEARVEIFRDTVEALQAAGYLYIGMDHFALPDSHLARAQEKNSLHRCFQGYSSHADCDSVGFGASAISQIGDYYFQNEKRIRHYSDQIDGGGLAIARGYKRDSDDRRVAAVIQSIMCDAGIDKTRWERRFMTSFDDYFAKALGELGDMAKDGLVTLLPDSIRISETGTVFLRTIARCFDRHSQRIYGTATV